MRSLAGEAYGERRLNHDTLLITALLSRGDGLSRQAAARLRELTEDAPEGQVFGRLTIFGGWRDPEVDGVSIRLHVIHQRFLQAMARHPGYWVSQDALIDALWRGDRSPVDPTACIYSYASRLRQQFTHALGFNPIESARGLGYRLNVELLKQRDAA